MAVTISSRTPEGRDSRCPMCGAEAAIEFSLANDATCPKCGCLLWGEEAASARLRRIIAEQLAVDPGKITDATSFVNDLGADSLDTVELVMELEEEFDVQVPDDAAEKIQTVGDLIRYLLERRKKKLEGDCASISARLAKFSVFAESSGLPQSDNERDDSNG